MRLIAETIGGSGSITASGGNGASFIYNRNTNSYSDTCYSTTAGAGAVGRILLEGNTISQNIATTPQAAFGPPLALYPAEMPALTIVAVGGVAVPSSAKGAMETPDVWLPYNTVNPVTVEVQALNVPSGASITVKAQPVEGAVASKTVVLAGNSASVPLTLSTAFPSVITAYASYTLTASTDGPRFADGELVASVRVETVLGGGSKVYYITESGREVAAAL